MCRLVESRCEIVDRIRGLTSQLRMCGIRRLALFGSFVRDEQQAESDVDLLVDFLPGKKSYDNLFAASELLEHALGRRVELLTRESLCRRLV
jgi:uncharacterized protein